MHYIINIKPLFHRAICLAWKNFDHNPSFLLKSVCYNFQKMNCQQAIKNREGNNKFLVIANKYKDIFDDFMNSSDEKSQDQPRPIDKRSCKAPRFKSNSRNLLEGENGLDWSLRLVLETRKSQVYQHHDIASLNPKIERPQYEKNQREGKEKNQGGGEKKGQKGWESC